MRLIDADGIHYCSYDLDNYHSFMAVTDDDIAEMPTIDAVEVVRCRDCKHFVHENMLAEHCCLTGSMVCGDDFCSYGERRTDG